MRLFLVSIFWAVLIIFDGVILPVVSGLPFGFGIFVFFSSVVSCFGSDHGVIYLGIGLALISELILGVPFGSLVGSWLAIVLIWHFVGGFLNLGFMDRYSLYINFVPSTVMAMILFLVGLFAQGLIIHFFYDRSLSFNSFVILFRSVQIMGLVLIETVLSVFCLEFLNSKKEIIYG